MITLTELSEFTFPRVATPGDLATTPEREAYTELAPSETVDLEVAVPTSERNTWLREHFPVDAATRSVAQRAVHLFKSSDVYCTPIFGTIIRTDGAVLQESYEGARWVTPTKALIPCVTVEGGVASFTPPAALETIESGFVFINLGGSGNYGHFVLDCLSALVLAEAFLVEAEVPIVAPPLKPWQRRHIELLGLRVPVIETAASAVCVRTLYHSDAMNYFLRAPNAAIGQIADRQLRSLSASGEGQGRVFLAREDRVNRLFPQEGALIARLEPFGFRAVRPETMSVDEQVLLLHDADIVLGPFGAAFTNILYCRPGTLVIVLVPSAVRGDMFVRNICAVRGCQWVELEIPSIAPDQIVVVEGEERPTVGFSYDPAYDVEKIIDAIRPLIVQDDDPASFRGGSGLDRFARRARRWLDTARSALTGSVSRSP